jgi:hypothetical protein
MASSPESSQTQKPAKPRARAKKPAATDGAALGTAGDDADLPTRIARRAYELSQSDASAGDEQNWLQAEREIRGA